MGEIRDILGLDGDDVPDYSTIYKSFDRFKMGVWRALLRVSAQQHTQSGHVALENIFSTVATPQRTISLGLIGL